MEDKSALRYPVCSPAFTSRDNQNVAKRYEKLAARAQRQFEQVMYMGIAGVLDKFKSTALHHEFGDNDIRCSVVSMLDDLIKASREYRSLLVRGELNEDAEVFTSSPITRSGYAKFVHSKLRRPVGLTNYDHMAEMDNAGYWDPNAFDLVACCIDRDEMLEITHGAYGAGRENIASMQVDDCHSLSQHLYVGVHDAARIAMGKGVCRTFGPNGEKTYCSFPCASRHPCNSVYDIAMEWHNFGLVLQQRHASEHDSREWCDDIPPHYQLLANDLQANWRDTGVTEFIRPVNMKMYPPGIYFFPKSRFKSKWKIVAPVTLIPYQPSSRQRKRLQILPPIARKQVYTRSARQHALNRLKNVRRRIVPDHMLVYHQFLAPLPLMEEVDIKANSTDQPPSGVVSSEAVPLFPPRDADVPFVDIEDVCSRNKERFLSSTDMSRNYIPDPFELDDEVVYEDEDPTMFR